MAEISHLTTPRQDSDDPLPPRPRRPTDPPHVLDRVSREVVQQHVLHLSRRLVGTNREIPENMDGPSEQKQILGKKTTMSGQTTLREVIQQAIAKTAKENCFAPILCCSIYRQQFSDIA